MAKLSDETLTTVFNLQKQFLESIDAATATEFIIFERFGETEELECIMSNQAKIPDVQTSTATRKSKVKSQKSKVLIGKGFMIFGLVTYFRRAALVSYQIRMIDHN